MDERAGWDQIHICDLGLTCTIGVFEAERREKQNVCLNLTLYTNLRQAGQSDNLADTVDYKELKGRIMAWVGQSACLLIERLAEGVAEICLATPRVEAVKVRVGKPGALRWARTVEVEILRQRGDRRESR